MTTLLLLGAPAPLLQLARSTSWLHILDAELSQAPLALAQHHDAALHFGPLPDDVPPPSAPRLRVIGPQQLDEAWDDEPLVLVLTEEPAELLQEAFLSLHPDDHPL